MSNPSNSSGLLAASAAVMVMPGTLTALTVLTDGTNAATVTIYDNKSAASGTILAKLIVPGAASSACVVLPEAGVVANQGLYCSITGTGAPAAIVHYTLG